MKLHGRAPVAWARVAGVLWLICIACGMFAEAYVGAKLILPHDPAGTIRNIFANEQLYRLGFTPEFAGTFPVSGRGVAGRMARDHGPECGQVGGFAHASPARVC